MTQNCIRMPPRLPRALLCRQTSQWVRFWTLCIWLPLLLEVMISHQRHLPALLIFCIRSCEVTFQHMKTSRPSYKRSQSPRHQVVERLAPMVTVAWMLPGLEAHWIASFPSSPDTSHQMHQHHQCLPMFIRRPPTLAPLHLQTLVSLPGIHLSTLSHWKKPVFISGRWLKISSPPYALTQHQACHGVLEELWSTAYAKETW